MPEATVNNKQIAKYIAPILGVSPGATRFWDDDKEYHLDIFHVTDPLNEDIKFYGTLGVSQENVSINGVAQNFALELLIGGDKSLPNIPNILSTCGFYITKNKWECKPGVVFKRMVEMYYPVSNMRHIYFTNPFVWQDKLKPLQLENKKIVWLLAIPISENELQYKIENGDKAFEALLAQHDVDVFDLNRKSIC